MSNLIKTQRTFTDVETKKRFSLYQDEETKDFELIFDEPTGDPTEHAKGKRFAVAQFGEPGQVNIKSNFMTFKEMECFLFGVNAVKNGTINF